MEIATSILKFYVEMIELARESIRYFSRSSGGKEPVTKYLLTSIGVTLFNVGRIWTAISKPPSLNFEKKLVEIRKHRDEIVFEADLVMKERIRELIEMHDGNYLHRVSCK